MSQKTFLLALTLFLALPLVLREHLRVQQQGQTIRAIFDWDNSESLTLLDWMEDIQQIGLNSKTRQRRQIVDGTNAFFNYGGANIPSELDISNLGVWSVCSSLARNFVGAGLEDWDTSESVT